MPQEIESLEPRKGNQIDWESGLPRPQPPPASPPPDYFTAPVTATYQLSQSAASRYAEFLSDLKSDQELGSFLQIFIAGIPFLTLFIGGPKPMTPIEIATSEWELIAKSAAGLPDLTRAKYRDRCHLEAISETFEYTPTDRKLWRNFCEVFSKRPAPPPAPVAPTPPVATPANPPYELPAGDPTGAGKGPRPGAKAPPANSPASPAPVAGTTAAPSPVAPPAVPPASVSPGWNKPA